MNLQNEKLQIIQQLINLQDAGLINKIKLMIEQEAMVINNPMSLEDFYDRILASEKAYIEGKVTAHQALKEEIKSWKVSH
jgi:hypothetical protein